MQVLRIVFQRISLQISTQVLREIVVGEEPQSFGDKSLTIALQVLEGGADLEGNEFSGKATEGSQARAPLPSKR